MTTAPATPTRPTAPMPPTGARPGAAPGPGAAVIPLDPVRLLRQYYPFLLVAAVMGAAIGVATHFIWLFTFPIWKSTVVFKCHPPRVSLVEQERTSFTQDEMDRFMGTEVQGMKAEAVLQEAVENPELQRTEWAKQFYRNGQFQPVDAMLALEEDLGASIIPRTYLIRLTMTAHDKESVAVIAKAVADAYSRDLRESGSRGSSERRAALSRKLTSTRTEIQNRQDRIEQLLRENSVDDLEVARTVWGIRVAQTEQQLVEKTEDLSLYRTMLERFEQQLAEGGDIYGDDLREQAKQDPVILQAEQLLGQLKAERGALLAQGYGSEHPDVKALTTRVDSTQRERDEKLSRKLRELFDAQIQSVRTQVEGLEEAERELLAKQEEATLKRRDILRLAAQIRQIEREIDMLNESEALVQAALDDIMAIIGLSDAYQVTVLRSAQTPNEVYFPKLKILIPLGAFLVTGLVAGLLVLRELLDQRVKGPADISLIPRLRLLGIVPEASEDPARPREVATAFRDTPTGVVTEAFRQLRAPVIRLMGGQDHKSLLVFGAVPGSGATAVASNLAMACAAAQERVLLIDANFRRPAMHRVFDLPDAPGLADVLAGENSLDDAVRPGVVDSMDVMTAGSAANRALPERLANSAMAKLLAHAATQYDRVILDAPPAIVSGDGYALANLVDSVAVVVRAMREKRGLLARIRSQLAESRADLTGVIVNAVQSSAGGYFKRNIRATHEYAAVAD